MSINKRHLIALAITTAFASQAHIAMAEDAPAPSWTGHVDLTSKYVLRGITTTYGPASTGLGNQGADAPESNKPALQWGADWTHPSGFYLGYWGSTINYSYKQLGGAYSDRTITDFQTKKSIENDLYGGYTGKIGDFGYTAGLTYYYYINGTHSNAPETKFGASYKDFSLNAQTLLQDVVWGNKGDTYWTLNYTKGLPYDLTFTSSLGYYTYTKEGKYNGTVDTLTNTPCAAGSSFAVAGCAAGGAPSASGFRHLILGISQPLGKSGVTWTIQEIIGGKNRFDVKQKNQLVGSISYGF